jgi:uncharacterized protein YbaR (Trm112 family)
MKLSSELLKILICPVTSSSLVYDADAQELISHEAGLVYPVRNGIPILLVDHSRNIDKMSAPSETGTAQS